jgi:hypothetical protein
MLRGTRYSTDTSTEAPVSQAKQPHTAELTQGEECVVAGYDRLGTTGERALEDPIVRFVLGNRPPTPGTNSN